MAGQAIAGYDFMAISQRVINAQIKPTLKVLLTTQKRTHAIGAITYECSCMFWYKKYTFAK